MARRRQSSGGGRVLHLEAGGGNSASSGRDRRYHLIDSDTRLPALVDPFAPATEQFRLLRTRLDAALPPRTDGGHVVLVTSALPGDGKTTCSINLAIVAAQEVGQRILLLEADLRSPSVVRYVQSPPAWGLSEVLQGKAAMEDVLCPMVAPANLHLILAGRPSSNPVGLLGSPAMSNLIATVRRDYDLVIVDTPPSLHFADAAEIASLGDGFLLVARSGKTMRDPLLKTHRRLSSHRILGVVCNDMVVRPSATYYSYYRYGQEQRDDAENGGGGR